MDRGRLTQWLEAYEKAWRTPGTNVLAKLFTEDATYLTAPYEKPHRGLEAKQGVPGPVDRLPERRQALLPLRGMALLATGSAGRRRERGRVTL